MKQVVWIHGFLGSAQDLDGLEIPNAQIHAFEIQRSGNLETLAYDLKKFVEQRGLERPFLWGYSMGGRIALKFLELFPEDIAGLILESSAHSALQSSPAEWLAQNQLWAHKFRTQNVQEVLEEWYSQPLFKPFKTSPNYSKTLKIRLTNLRDGASCSSTRLLKNEGRSSSQSENLDSKKPGTELPSAQVNWGDGALFNRELWAQLLIDASQATNPLLEPGAISVPTLVVLGEKDPKYVALWTPFVDKNENLDIRIVPQAGHVIHLENPTGFLQVTSQWLNGKE